MDEKTKALNESERAELEVFRLRERDAAFRQACAMQNSVSTLGWAELQNASPLLDRSATIGESRKRTESVEPLSLPRLILKFIKIGFIGVLCVVLAGYLFLELATILGWM